MTTFKNGPASGKSLMLKRAPHFLRVTQCGDAIDALDQIEDSPRADEALTAYEIVGKATSCHLRLCGNARKASGFYMMATYTMVFPQPDEATMRDNELWRQWAERALFDQVNAEVD